MKKTIITLLVLLPVTTFAAWNPFSWLTYTPQEMPVEKESLTLGAAPRVFDSSQVGASPVANYYLKTDGVNSTWAAVTGGSGGGAGTFSTSTAFGTTLYNFPINASDILLAGYSGSGVATSSNSEFYVDPVAKLASFLNSTKLGIGTSTPYAPLSVVGEIVGSYFTATSTTGNSTFASKIGIGTTTPTGLLDIYTSAYTSLQPLIRAFRANGGLLAEFEDNGWNSRLQILTQSANDIFIKAGASDSLSFATGNSSTANLHITSTGDVGIGTTSPYAKLSVTNTGTDPSFVVEDSTSPDSSPFIINNNGFVSIGTTTANSRITATNADGSVTGLFTGASKAVRLYSTSAITHIEGVDQTGITSYQPLNISGSYLTLSNSVTEVLRVTDDKIGIGSTTPGTLLSLGNTGNDTINISTTATSTFGSGINIRTGCFAVNGVCISGGSVGSSASTTLLVDNNTFTGQNTFNNAQTQINGRLNIGSSVAPQFTGFGTGYYDLHYSTSTNDVAGWDMYNISTGSQAATGLWFQNANSNLGGIGLTQKYYGGIVYSGSNWNGPALGLGALPANSLGVFTVDGSLILGSATTTGKVDLYTGANSFSGGVPDVRLDSTGNLGIGTSTPFGKLSVASFNGGSAPQFVIASSTGTGATTTTLILDKDGKMGLGTTSPLHRLTIQTSGTENDQLSIIGQNNTGYTNFWMRGTGRTYQIGVGNAGEVAFGVASKYFIFDRNGNAMRMVIDTGGNVGFGTTTPYAKLSVVGTVAFDGLTTSTAGNAVCILTNDSVVNAGGSTCATSAIDTKKNIDSISSTEASKIVMGLKPVSFNYKESGERRVGFIAEDVAKVDTRLVDYAKEDIKYDAIGVTIKKGNPVAVQYANVTSLLTKFVQDFYTKFQTLVAKVSGLEDRVNKQEARIKLLEDKLNKL